MGSAGAEEFSRLARNGHPARDTLRECLAPHHTRDGELRRRVSPREPRAPRHKRWRLVTVGAQVLQRQVLQPAIVAPRQWWLRWRPQNEGDRVVVTVASGA
jgi:hypothetical protein